MSLNFVTRIQSRKRKTTRQRPILESLEERVQLSTFRVNTLLDTVAVNLKNGKDSSGHISLRSAIMAADANKGSNTIIVPAGTFTLTIPGANEDADATGDLDVKGKITIKGAGATKTIVNGNGIDRVIEILSGNVTVQKLTIEGGLASEGAGLLNLGGKVTLSSVVVAGNTAQGTAGSAGVQGSGGGAVGGAGGAGFDGLAGDGGGIFNAAGSMTISNSTISSNVAIGGNGGNGGQGGAGEGAIGASGANGQSGTGGAGGGGGDGGAGLGGGIFNAAGAKLTISGSEISVNTARGGKGGAGGAGFLGNGGNGGDDAGSGAGNGGSGIGGKAGNGGVGGNAIGGGLYNLGTATFSGSMSTVRVNGAAGGLGGDGGAGGVGLGLRGGNGSGGRAGGSGGFSEGGAGGEGGASGSAKGGGIYNGTSATLTNTTGLVIEFNVATGNAGGGGGSGGNALSFQGGTGGGVGNGGSGGEATGNDGGFGGLGGEGFGGGLYNDVGGTVVYKAGKNPKNPTPSLFVSNTAEGGLGGFGGNGGTGGGGDGGGGQNATGGFGGTGLGGFGGQGGGAGDGDGGGLDNNGTATFTGITVNFTSNQAVSGTGGRGGNGGTATGGFGGNGAVGGRGGNATGGNGGDGGFSSFGIGGGIHNANATTLLIDPRLHTKKGSKQSKATDLITGNKALASVGGAAGFGASATAGSGGTVGGSIGTATNGTNGASHPLSIGAGGGIFTVATATIDNTSITGNTASSLDNDVDGTIVP